MDFFFFVFIAFTIFVLCSLCGFCCRKKESGAIYSTPVVITSETHQGPGNAYTQQTTITSSVPLHNPQMPMPYPVDYPAGNAPPYPSTQPIQPYPNTGYPPQAPYPQQPGIAPYPQPGAPYPPAAYPPQNMMPPSYSEVVSGYQKQEPYNPSYPGN